MTIQENLIKYTCDNSNFETKRNYISLSNIYYEVDKLIDQYKNGYTADEKALLKCYKGYQMERDLILRMSKIYEGTGRFVVGYEINPFNGLIKGHPDFIFDGYPGDCKSVLMDEHLPNQYRLPKKVYWQIQAYMLYMNKSEGIIIYESRESGIIMECRIKENSFIQTEIKDKIEIILNSKL
jgi:hypothetical protein